MSAVLVLNQNYEPLNVCNARRALVLVDGGKAEVLEHAEVPIRTPNRLFPRPSVIRLVYMITTAPRSAHAARSSCVIITRGSCGIRPRPALDHVVPRHARRAAHRDNLVSACRRATTARWPHPEARMACRAPLARARPRITRFTVPESAQGNGSTRVGERRK